MSAGALRPATVRAHAGADHLRPSALLTPANAITVLRLLATPVVIVLIMLWGASWFTFVLRRAAGHVRRHRRLAGPARRGPPGPGAFLDPLADKVVVLGALFALVAKGIVWWLPVAIIAVREVAMSVYRSVVGRHGISIPARNSAKVKTLLQDIAIGLCLAPPLATHHGVLLGGHLGGDGHDRVHRRASTTSTAGGPARTGATTPARVPAPPTARARRPERPMRIEIVAVGTELLLGQIADTNSQWMGEHLAAVGVDLALPPGGRGQPRAHRAGLPHRAGPQRRGDRVRRARARPTTTSPATPSPR